MSLVSVCALTNMLGLACGQWETDFVLAKAIAVGDSETIRGILRRDPDSGSRRIYRDLTAIQFACSPGAPPMSFVSVIQSVGTSPFVEGSERIPIESLYEVVGLISSEGEADRRQAEKIVYLGEHAPSLLFARGIKSRLSISNYRDAPEPLVSLRALSHNWPRTIRALSNCGALPADAVLYAKSLEAISVLAASGFTMNARDSDGNTALHLRLADGSGGEVVAALLGNGLKPTALNHAGRTAMHIAAENFESAGIGLLRGLGFNARASDKEGLTPLHLISKGFWPGVPLADAQGCIAALLEAGARVNDRDAAGHTPLMHLLQNDQAAPESWALITYLVSRGADLHARDTLGRSVLHLVRPEWDVPEQAGQVIVRLLELGADASGADADGNTVLHRIVLDHAFHNYYDAQIRAIRGLLAHGARADTVNGVGRTPLDDAVTLYGNNSEVARALRGG